MKNIAARLLIIIAGMVCAPQVYAQKGQPPSDAQVRQQIIGESIASYPGRCPCPYNAAKNGSACGGRSAWSRKGGYAPICYDREITAEMVRKWRQENGAQAVAAR
ncbi:MULTISPECIES: hypothetical protein [unclassified Janthinobacterium]|uniref:hypothetical protein n=1 Tax=unclassified Janthinobacterium TaxID=2610881 RepID=UPI0017E64492|nr:MULTISPECIES: hypothetical protein [unclassified Janthinobacterium]MBB5367123.1 hypothetical protein [Janthinobacterium sp. K2C7]MBB5380399.1 hypothetical protein [Janthinobacterium sp. K2Li3]MBB5385505.1 hypothetical protein [Janthinobacterium sp. K2E3]